MMKGNINPKKGLNFDSLIGEILKQLPREGSVLSTYLIYAAFSLKFDQATWITGAGNIWKKPEYIIQ